MSRPPSVDVEIVTARGARLDRLVPAWAALAAAHGRSFVSRPAYGLAWFGTLGGRGRLHVVTVRRAGVLVALAPLHRRTLLGQPVLRWLGHGLGTIGEVLTADEQAADALWTALAAQGAVLQLTHVRPDDPAMLALRRHRGYAHHLRIDNRCPVIPLPPGTTARALRSKHSLARLARYRNALTREDRPFRVEVVDTVDGLRRRWPDIVAVAAVADAGRDRDNLCGPPYDVFTFAVLEAEAGAGNLLVVGALVGERWVAHDIGLRTGTVLEQWLTRFDPELTKYSPGHLMREWVVDHHDQLVVDTVDQLLGETAIKLSWSRHGYDVATLTAALTAAPTAAPSGLGLARARLGLAAALGDAVRRARR